MKEASGNNGVATKVSEGAKSCNSRTLDNISEIARKQSAQWPQASVFMESADKAAPWQGGAEMTAAANVSPRMAGDACDFPCNGINFPPTMEMGKTVAALPMAGSQATIQINTSLRRKFTFMGQGYRKMAPEG